MKEKYNLEHKYIKLDSMQLIDGLYNAMKARDLPGMGDMELPIDEEIPAANPEEVPVENVEVPVESVEEVPEA